MGAGMTATLVAFSFLIFLTNVAHLRPALAGTVLLVGKVWDALNDPIVGVLSDRTRSRWGRRHVWMIFSAIPFGILFFLQWVVPPFAQGSQWGLFWYYVAVSILFNTAFTAVNLPYTALTPELTSDYNERTSLNSFRFAFSIGGSLLALILGAVFSGAIESPQQQYLWLGAACAVLSVFPLYWCVVGTRHRAISGSSDSPQEAGSLFAPLQAALKRGLSVGRMVAWMRSRLQAILENPAYRAFGFVIGIYLCSWLAFQLTAAMIPYYAVNWMKMDSYFVVALIVQTVAMVALFLWSFLSQKIGRKKVYFAGMGVWIIAQGGLFFLSPDRLGGLYLLCAMAGLGVATAYLIPWSMLTDVTDLDELLNGQRREGTFYAFMVFLQKLGLALGLFLSGQALELAGFVETPPGQLVPPEQPESALLAIRLVVGPVPTVLLVIGLALAYLYPISREIHADIVLKLQQRRSDRESPSDR